MAARQLTVSLPWGRCSTSWHGARAWSGTVPPSAPRSEQPLRPARPTARPPAPPILMSPAPRHPPSVCEKGALLCEPGGCPVPCGWSAWSSWGPCDRSCGSGLRARFRCAGRGAMEPEGMGRHGASGGPRGGGAARGGVGSGAHPASLLRSPSNPPAASGGAPCEGQRQELQACYSACGAGGSPPASVLQILPGERGWVEPAGHSAGWSVLGGRRSLPHSGGALGRR